MTCTGCGTRSEEWVEARQHGEPAYVADHRICMGCEALEQEDQNVHKEAKGVKKFLRTLEEARYMEEHRSNLEEGEEPEYIED